MIKGFAGLILLVFAFCGIFAGAALIIAGFALIADPQAPWMALVMGGIGLTSACVIICRKLLGAFRKALEEDRKNPPPAQYVPGKHRCDPK